MGALGQVGNDTRQPRGGSTGPRAKVQGLGGNGRFCGGNSLGPLSRGYASVRERTGLSPYNYGGAMTGQGYA